MANHTIYDDVFRTMLEKMPQLAVPLINEVFGTDYPLDVEIIQKRNEYQTKNGEIITDSHLKIKNKVYHIECQSTWDFTMEIRMVEYDFAIGLGNIRKEDGVYRIYFPSSCVLYLRGKSDKDHLVVELISRIGNHILRDEEQVKERFGEVMGGKVLELESDKLIKQGIEQGIEQGMERERKNTERERKNAEKALQKVKEAEEEIRRLKQLLQEKGAGHTEQ